jgi:hypothetical protein
MSLRITSSATKVTVKVGATGPQGAKGDTGAIGPVGIGSALFCNLYYV